MEFNVLTIPDAVKIFNQYFDVEIKDFVHLEQCLSDEGPQWTEIPDWDLGVPQEKILEILNLETIPGRVLIVNRESYHFGEDYSKMRGNERFKGKLGVYDLRGEDVDEFILSYPSYLPGVFFNYWDIQIIWLDVGRVAFISHEGWFYIFNKTQVVEMIKNHVPWPSQPSLLDAIRARNLAKKNQDS